MSEEHTKGEFRIGTDFNPSGNPAVARIKALAAELIDLVGAIPSDSRTTLGNEKGRLKALAQTDIEKGAMWAVKAATKQAP